MLLTDHLIMNKSDKLIIFFLIFPENRISEFMSVVSLVYNLHDISNPIFWGKKKKKIQNVFFYNFSQCAKSNCIIIHVVLKQMI